MIKITLQKKLLGLFIIILGMDSYTKGMEQSDDLYPTTGDTIYLDPVNAPFYGTGKTPSDPAKRGITERPLTWGLLNLM